MALNVRLPGTIAAEVEKRHELRDHNQLHMKSGNTMKIRINRELLY
jgi:hypothetical protein